MSTPLIHLLMLENKLNKKNTDNTTLDNNTHEINGNSNQCIIDLRKGLTLNSSYVANTMEIKSC